MKNKITAHEDYVNSIQKKFKGRIIIEGKYNGYREKIEASCIKHGPIKNKKAGDLKRSKYGCDICAKEEAIKKCSDDFETVIKKARNIHKNLYNYEKAQNTNTKILNIYCKKHNKYFNQSKKSHLQGHTACPLCKLEKQKNRDTSNMKVEVKDINSFIKKAKEIHGDKYNYKTSKYISMFEKLDIYCNKCKKIFPQTPNDHIHKRNGCPICKINNLSDKFALEKDDFLKRAKKIHGDKYEYDLSNFVNSNTKIEVFCKIHNLKFEITPGKLLNGHGCYECGKDNIRLNLKDVISQSKKIFKNKYNYDNSKIFYKNKKTYFTFFCKSCNVEVEQRVDKHLKGGNCKYCEGAIKDNKMFIRKAKKIHDNIYDYSNVKYKHHLKNVEIICKKHGPFMQTPKIHLGGSGCPSCSSSKGEKKIAKYLKLNNIKFIHDKPYSKYCKTKKEDEKLRFDFFIPEIKLFIEYDGRQHFKAENYGSSKITRKERLNNEQKRDHRKNTLVSKNENYKLLRIKFTDFDRINEILRVELNL